MNILREFRRSTKRSIATRIRLILLFSVILIVNTYAWFSSQKNITIGGRTRRRSYTLGCGILC